MSRQESRKDEKNEENDGSGLLVSKLSLEFIEIHGGGRAVGMEKQVGRI